MKPGSQDGACAASDPPMLEARRRMLDLLRSRNIRDARVLDAMASLPRERFFPEGCSDPALAYGDHPCPIGWGQTISQPYIVAYMCERLAASPGERVLEIGTGSGYNAAVLAAMGLEVWGLERVADLARHACRVLDSLGFGGVRVREGDGFDGWPEAAPFDAILGTCAPPEVPDALVEQLSPSGGRLLMPVGTAFQELVRITRRGDRLERRRDLAVRFVPMVHGRMTR